MSLVTLALIAAFLVGLLLLRVLAVTLDNNRPQPRVRVAVRRPRPPYRR